jgi:hypothetical protein
MGMESVKVVVDKGVSGTGVGGAVHLLSPRAWEMHYTWVHEVVEHQTPFDLCDPTGLQAFYVGWTAFSDKEYRGTSKSKRRFHLFLMMRYVLTFRSSRP